jgi:hypothetical protein
MGKAKRVVLITDVGVDVNDTLALLLVALHTLQGDLDLRGLITCGTTRRSSASSSACVWSHLRVLAGGTWR